MNRTLGVLVAALMLLSVTCVLAQDWPQWRGINRDAKVAGFTPPANWPGELVKKWSVQVGAGDSTPALVGDKLYVFSRVGDEEVLSCLQAADGHEIWKKGYTAPAVQGPSARVHAGPRSSPAVANGKVVTLGVSGVVTCYDAGDGKILWNKDIYPGSWPKFYTATSPMIVDGMAITQLGNEAAGAIVAFNLADGEVKWKWDGEGPMYASPAVMTVEGTKQVVTMTAKGVVGVGLADGKLLWQIAFAPTGMAYNDATPIIDGQTVIYTGQGRGTYAVKIEKQGDGFVVKKVWGNDDVATKFNTPVLKDGMLYGMTANGNLFCMNAADGKTAWVDQVKRGTGFAAMVDAGAVIIALPDNSELTVFKPSEKEYSEVVKYKVSSTPTYGFPIIAGDKIYVKDQDTLTQWTVK